MQLNKNQQIQRRFTWNIHYDCNFRCPYCFFEGKWSEYGKRNIYLAPDAWMKFWDKIYRDYGRCFILITGGEPFTYPNFIELAEKLSGVHYPINISTNASGDLKTFAERIDPERVSLSVSFQPYFDSLNAFFQRVKYLRKYSFNGCINFVAYPPFIKDLDTYIGKFKSIGEELKIIPFWGRYQDKEYPFAYTEEEKNAIGINGSWFESVRKKNSLCPAGFNSALIFPDAKVARCGQIGERAPIGNFLDRGFRLLDGPLPCDAEYCPCDENRLFDEKDDSPVAIKFNDEGRQDKLNNSLLNDDEFNSRKIVLTSSPKEIFIQASGPCNSSCVFCSRGPEYELFDLDNHRKRFEKKLYPFIAKAETLILTGSGEFLRLPQAEDILDFFDNSFPHVNKFFASNGTSLVPWVNQKITNSKSCYTIHVSLHASNPALHKVITRMDNFEQILEQVKHLIKLRKDNTRPQVNLIFVATTLNIEDLPNFVRLAANLSVDKVVCYYNYIYIPTQKYLSCFFKQELTNRMLDEAESLAKRLKIKIDLPPRFGQKDYPRNLICREPFSQIMFDTAGHALPCDASEDCHEVLDENKDFMDIWNSAYYQSLRKALIEGRNSCFNHCLRANPASVNNFSSHVIHRGVMSKEDMHILWGDNF